MKNEVVSTPEKCRSAEKNATMSACCGAVGDVTLTDSAVIILFAGMLGAGDMFSMITTSLIPLFNGLCIIPMAWLATKIGRKGLIIRVCTLSAIAYFLIVASPFFGGSSVAMLIAMLIFFAVCHTGYTAGWFPLLDSFLSKERRSGYLSGMRFSWQLAAVVFLLVVGLAIGKEPPIWKLQVVLLLGAVIYMGRIFFISRIPVFAGKEKEVFGFKEGLMAAIGDKPLVGYSVYLFVLNLAAYGTIPLVTIYLKKHLNAPDNIIVIISAMTMVGMLLGSISAGKIIKRWGIKDTLLGIHISYALVNLAIFFIGEGNNTTYILITVLLIIYSFTFAAASIASTSEMMALAAPGNKTMAMAFCGTFYYSGSGLSRMLSSLVLGSGMLAAEWNIGAMKICHYQTLFLIYAISIIFAAMFLVVVPAVFPKGEYVYDVH